MKKSIQKEKQNLKSIDQMTVAKIIADTHNIPLSIVIEIIELEQKLTMQYVKDGYKVIKKNYITLTPIIKKGYVLKSKITGKSHQIDDRSSIKVTLGQGFKVYVSGTKEKMPDKMCRFVDKGLNSIESIDVTSLSL
jgi:hypothetical protein